MVLTSLMVSSPSAPTKKSTRARPWQSSVWFAFFVLVEDADLGGQRGFDAAVRELEHPALDLAADDGGFDEDLGIGGARELDGGVEVVQVREAADAAERPGGR